MNFQSIRPLRKNELMYEMTDINMLELIQRVIFISEDYLLYRYEVPEEMNRALTYSSELLLIPKIRKDF